MNERRKIEARIYERELATGELTVALEEERGDAWRVEVQAARLAAVGDREIGEAGA